MSSLLEISSDLDHTVRLAEFVRSNLAFNERLPGVGESPAMCMDLAKAQPFLADDRAAEKTPEPVCGSTRELDGVSAVGEADGRWLLGQSKAALEMNHTRDELTVDHGIFTVFSLAKYGNIP